MVLIDARAVDLIVPDRAALVWTITARFPQTTHERGEP
jgi:hypothetical protein